MPAAVMIATVAEPCASAHRGRDRCRPPAAAKCDEVISSCPGYAPDAGIHDDLLEGAAAAHDAQQRAHGRQRLGGHLGGLLAVEPAADAEEVDRDQRGDGQRGEGMAQEARPPFGTARSAGSRSWRRKSAAPAGAAADHQRHRRRGAASCLAGSPRPRSPAPERTSACAIQPP